MSKRVPTPEEKRLWRESNKFTIKKSVGPAEEDDPELHETEPPATLKPAVKTTAPAAQKSPPKTPLKPLSTREAKPYLGSHPYIQATLDLHGLTKLEAHELVQQFITRNHRTGRRHVVIITGKGKGGEGVLRKALPDWLNDKALRPLLASMFYAGDRDGGHGVMHVILKALKS